MIYHININFKKSIYFKHKYKSIRYINLKKYTFKKEMDVDSKP